MSVNIDKYKPKFIDGALTKDSNPYVLLLSEVLQSNIDANCLAVWSSLQSRPDNWILSPQQLQNQFGWGRDKTYQVLNKLIDIKLLQRIEIRSSDGRIEKVTYHIKDGKEFLINQGQHPLPGFPDTDKPDTDNQHTTYNRSLQILDIKNKDKDMGRVSKAKRSTPNPHHIDPSFEPNDSHYIICASGDLDAEKEKDKFIDHFLKTGKKYIDWNAAFRNWLRKAAEYRQTDKAKSPVKSVDIQHNLMMRAINAQSRERATE